jgi:hypothetical protein
MEEHGFVNKHITQRGEGLHHMGLEVDDLEGFIEETKAKGFRIPLQDEFSNRKEVILSPRDSAGVILQILQWKGGSDKTIEDRIKRILSLENIVGKKKTRIVKHSVPYLVFTSDFFF